MKDQDRALLFRRGFNDGVRGCALKHKNRSDYLSGYLEGQRAMNEAVTAFRKRHELEPANPLRVVREEPQP